jgi:protein MpaA
MISLDSVVALCRAGSAMCLFSALCSTCLLAEDAKSSPTTPEALPLITPFNFDPADPGEYSRRAGVVTPGSVATGRTWNRPLPRVRLGKKPAVTIATSRKPAALAAPVLPPEPESAPIEPLVAPDESVAAATHIVISPATTAARAAELLPALGPQTRQLGKSVLGLPIVGHFFGVAGPKTLIFAAIHGDEPNTAFVANQLVEHLNKNPEAYYARRVAVVPVANPDGLARATRKNAREIDLNRNFPAKNFAVGKKDRYFGGEQPASEPETQLLIDLIEHWQPHRIITMHAITRGKHGNNFDGPAEGLAKIMSRHNEYSVLKSIGYPTPGSFGSWAGVDRQLPTITLELPSDAAGPAAWRENREALLSAIQAK